MIVSQTKSTYVIPLMTFLSSWSKNSLQVLFPPSLIRSISCALKASIVILLTKLMWTPNPRWTPAQDRQMKTPNFGEAHWGDGAPQSIHRSLPLVLEISRSYVQDMFSMSFVRNGGNGCLRSWMGAPKRSEYLWPRLRINLPHRLGSHFCYWRWINCWLRVSCSSNLSTSNGR